VHARELRSFAIWWFESSRPSQGAALREFALSNAENVRQWRALRFWQWSPGSRFRELRAGIAESLQPHPEIFPFLGDGGRRPGSIYTA
jgi:hypothetical protein